ncbi:unnamed protein product [Timema podura]|uniref:Uncharacterized protein n=1 Tax=Timema podura TaxID=61482 RepID=A0ABN7P9P6_TIMPD|nr:unnamed protein product [Timema podura]
MSPRTEAASGSPLSPNAIAIVSMTIIFAFPLDQVHKSLFAVWSKRDDLEIFAEEKIGLNGLVLRAATLQFSFIQETSGATFKVPRITLLVTSANSSQHQILDGMFGEVWQILEKKLNFTCVKGFLPLEALVPPQGATTGRLKVETQIPCQGPTTTCPENKHLLRGSSNPSYLCPSNVATHITCTVVNLGTSDPVSAIDPRHHWTAAYPAMARFP